MILRTVKHRVKFILRSRSFATVAWTGRVSGLSDGSESTKGQNGKYCGDWDDVKKVPSGQGTMSWDNGVTYEGQWEDGKFHGQGSKLYSRGGGFIGNWVANRREGNGIHLFAGKFGYDQWSGTFTSDQPHGVGTMLMKDGSEEAFEFNMGKPLSKAKYEFDGALSDLDDGSPSTRGVAGIYQGGWCKDSKRPDGFGIMKWENGIEYKGMWKQGLYHGHGRKLYSRGGGYEGQWNHGNREGKGISFYGEELTAKTGILRWEGAFTSNQAHGIGQTYIASPLQGSEDEERWSGDLAIKGALLEFNNGRVAN